MDYKKFNKECLGIIKELKVKGLEFPTKVVVEYNVNNKKYVLEEKLVMKKDKQVVLGFIPIGYKTKSLIKIRTGIKAIEGNSVKVKYEESNPSNAYLVDNVGKATWN